jgi:hypothetical protein
MNNEGSSTGVFFSRVSENGPVPPLLRRFLQVLGLPLRRMPKPVDGSTDGVTAAAVPGSMVEVTAAVVGSTAGAMEEAVPGSIAEVTAVAVPGLTAGSQLYGTPRRAAGNLSIAQVPADRHGGRTG